MTHVPCLQNVQAIEKTDPHNQNSPIPLALTSPELSTPVDHILNHILDFKMSKSLVSRLRKGCETGRDGRMPLKSRLRSGSGNSHDLKEVREDQHDWDGKPMIATVFSCR